ncbi:MAG: glutathione S-transferase N-terminal domain-containing protein [Rhodobacteraceae bacterium]|nr:glutathione S-transferase N-terminal domain-containing protein [Paracoccaceae bacterium]MCY4137405.1 glutathione S-transferase N-terminal domain-containing protein [Paracoccaceae bacterium]
MPEIEPIDQALKSLKGIHLWHAPVSSCSQRVRIALAECGKDYDGHLVDLEKDEHATPEYQRIHPKGLVPALIDDGRLYIESIDIMGDYIDYLTLMLPVSDRIHRSLRLPTPDRDLGDLG